MVNFSVFNELSLPLSQYRTDETFSMFFELLGKLKEKGLNQVRMSHEFKQYDILKNTSLQQFLGQCANQDLKTRLRSFIVNAVIQIDTPIIKENDQEQREKLGSCEYFYQGQSTNGGLACSDIWNTLAISFYSDKQWHKSTITIQKEIFKKNDVITNVITIKHAVNSHHLDTHKRFFQTIEEEKKRNITPDNFWKDRNKHFPNIVQFCPEVKDQLKRLDKNIFQQVIGILRDVESKRKLITDFNHSTEGETVCNHPSLKKQRMFTIHDKKEFFEKHIKSLPHGYRIYFLEKEGKVHIGYIGKHLKNKRDH